VGNRERDPVVTGKGEHRAVVTGKGEERERDEEEREQGERRYGNVDAYLGSPRIRVNTYIDVQS